MTTSAKGARPEAEPQQFKLRCNVTITARDRRGRFAARRKVKNLVVLAGRNLLVEMLGGTNNAYPTHMALGNGTTAVTDSDSALQAEQYRDLVTRRRSFSSRLQFQLFVDTTQGNGFTYTEAGIINVRNAVSLLFARVTFDPISKDSSTNLTVSWDIYIAAS